MDVNPRFRYLLRLGYRRFDRLLVWGLLHAPKGLSIVVFRAVCRALGVPVVSADGALGRMYGSPLDTSVFGEYLSTGRYSPGLMKLLTTEYLDAGRVGTFVDVGANIGLVTIPIAEEFEDVACFAFEPDPSNYRLLTQNLARLKERHVAAHNAALAAANGDIVLELSEWNHGDHRLSAIDTSQTDQFLERGRATVKVKAVALDDVLTSENLTRPIVVKIDTQGAEADVIEGGSRFLGTADMIVLEFWPYGIRRRGRDPDEILAFLQSRFSRAAIVETGNREYSPEFRHIADVVGDLRRFHQQVGSRTDTLDVVVKGHAQLG